MVGRQPQLLVGIDPQRPSLLQKALTFSHQLLTLRRLPLQPQLPLPFPFQPNPPDLDDRGVILLHTLHQPFQALQGGWKGLSKDAADRGDQGPEGQQPFQQLQTLGFPPKGAIGPLQQHRTLVEALLEGG